MGVDASRAAPVYLMGVAGAAGATVRMGSWPDRLGWYGQKTPWAVERTYDGRFSSVARGLVAAAL